MTRLRVNARADRCTPRPCTVLIDRAANLIGVRPLRRRRVYWLPLATVADMIVARVIRAELLLTTAADARARKADRRSTRKAHR